MEMKQKEKTTAFLSAYWLRPETAIWRTIMINLLRSISFKNPSIDLACGDGLFSFIACGGTLTSQFDVFSLHDTKGFQNKKDIYNQTWQQKPRILKRPRHTFDVGLDHKQKLLSNAKLFGIYKKLVQHDLSKPLPFPNNEFDTVFSDALYWISDIDFVLSEVSRICKRQAVVFVPDIKFKRQAKPYRWWEMLDRGISVNIKHCYTFSQWNKLFKKHGFKVKYHINFLTSDFIEFWRYGTRLYSPYMIEALERRIKQRVIKEMTPFVKSFVNYELSNINQNCFFHLFVLR